MKTTVLLAATFMILLSSGKGDEKLTLTAGGSSFSHLYLPNDRAAEFELEHDVVAGEFLKEYIKCYPDAAAIKGKLTVKVDLPEHDKEHQEGELYAFTYSFSVRGVELQVAEAYQKAVDRYLKLRAKGFTLQYAIELILPHKTTIKLAEDAKSIAQQYPDVDPLKLILVSSTQHQGWLQKTYSIKDGQFEWLYYMAIESSGKTEIQEGRKKLNLEGALQKTDQ
jgi:hypothetical protein